MINLENSKKRKLPRHIEGRIMLGLLPLKNLFKILPFAAIIITAVIILFSKTAVFIGVILLGLVTGAFTEITNKETGFNILLSIIKYQIHGDYLFERINNAKPIYKRFSRNKIKR